MSGLAPLILCIVAFGCAGPVDRLTATNDYAIAAAQQGLWKEAAYRWEQALEMDDGDVRVWNNLGVAREANGQLDEAIRAYRRALALGPGNDELARNVLRAEQHAQRSRTEADRSKARSACQPTETVPDEE